MIKRTFLSLLIVIAFQPAIALAVPDEIYVDPSIAADSGTGAIGDPYGDVQYALNNVNHGGDGARFNVKAGTAEVLATGGLTLATYFSTNGAPGATEPIIIQGYTSAAGDGGIGEFTGTANSSPFWTATGDNGQNTDNAAFVDLKITTAQASGHAIIIDNQVTFHNVWLISNHGGIDVDNGIINRCNISFVDTAGVAGLDKVGVVNSTFTQTSGALVPAISTCAVAIGNICNSRAATDSAAAVISACQVAVGNNTILANLSSGASSAAGIRISSQSFMAWNNYIEGFNSTADEAIDLTSSAVSAVLANNAFYGNTANVTDAGLHTTTVGSTSSLSASGVTSASGADYTPTADLIDAGYASSFLQLSGNANYPTIGAITPEHDAGGGGGTDQITIVPFYGDDIQQDTGTYPFEFGVYQNGIPFALASGAVQASLDSGADASTGLTLNTISTGRYEVVIDSDNAAFNAGGNLNLTLSAGTVDGNAVAGAKVGEVSIDRYSAAPANFSTMDIDGAGAVIIQNGTGDGQIATTSGAIDTVTTTGTVTNGVNVTQLLGTALTDVGSGNFGSTLAGNFSILFGQSTNESNTAIGASEINNILTRTNRIPNVAAGSSGGLLIAGSNAGTTFSTLTSTGAFSINGTSMVAQTGDSFARLGAPAGASVSADIAGIEAGSGLDAAGVRAAIGMASANLDVQLAAKPDTDEVLTEAELTAALGPVDADVVDDSRTWFATDYRARNIVTVGENFVGTLALQPDLNPGSTLAGVTSVSITGAATVTATDLEVNRSKTRAHFTVPALTTTGTYTVVVTVTTVDGQTIPTTATLKVQ